MASRRTRIKGIANIPQRRLPPKVLDNGKSAESDASNAEIKASRDTVTETLVMNDLSWETIGDQEQPSQETICINDLSGEQNDNAYIKNESQCMMSNGSKENSNITVPDIPVRRNFLKPSINVSVLKRNAKDKSVASNKSKVPDQANYNQIQPIKEEVPGSTQSETQSIQTSSKEKVHILSEIRIPDRSKVACNITKFIVQNPVIGFVVPFSESKVGRTEAPNNIFAVPVSEITFNEVSLDASDYPQTPQADSSSLVIFSKKYTTETHVSDSEYPAPPPSPSKINRSRIKAIPKLNLRKTSCSASESEDETRKYGRIRNNSVCSVASSSFQEPPPTPTAENAAPKEALPATPKKVWRNEQSRKLAEARREFYKRFGTNMPDKQQLKMIDLIFYNPTGNAMSQKPDNKKTESNTNTTQKETTEEPVDLEKTDKENDADNSMPVPQIKLNALGEFVLDEQSLIVENLEVAKQKEQIKNSALVNGDFDTGYGIYKRARRSLSWTQKETLRFYKALSLIGTDFTLMTKLFPKRARRELKIKFKKEEKVNKHLIDKALMQPCGYNFADLKREMELEEEEEQLLQKLKEEELEKMKQERESKRKRKLSKDDPIEILYLNEPGNDLPSKEKSIVPEPTAEPKKKAKKMLNISSVLEDDADADISDVTQSDSDEEEEIMPVLRATRSGRIPKSAIKFAIPEKPRPPPNKCLLNGPRNRRLSSTSSVESNSDKLVPGSLVITTEERPEGQPAYKVFMVTPEKKLAAVQLESDIVDRLVKERMERQNSSVVPQSSEANLTIPA